MAKNKEQTNKDTKKKSLKKIILIVVICAAVIGIAIGCLAGKFLGGEDEKALVYSVADLLGEGSANSNRFAGEVESQKTVEVSRDSNKDIKEVFVKEGDVVKKGDKLFEYDQTSMENELTSAQIDLKQFDIDIAEAQSQIKELKRERKEADSADKESYSLQIQLQENQIQRTKYEKEQKQIEVDNLKNNMGNTVVESEVEGIISKVNKYTNSSGVGGDDEEDDTSFMGDDNSSNDVLIKITSLGNYRVKCRINELNFSSISEGMEMTVFTRTSDDTYTGTISSIEVAAENAASDGGNEMDVMGDMGGESEDTLTSSSFYTFYVTLDNSDGLMIGQHVYVTDGSTPTVKQGLRLDEGYIVDPEGEAFVWAAGKNGKLEKRTVLLGDYDEASFTYIIESGLTKEDKIAYPDESLYEGMKTTENAEELGGDEEYDETYDEGDIGEDMDGDVGEFSEGEVGSVMNEDMGMMETDVIEGE